MIKCLVRDLKTGYIVSQDVKKGSKVLVQKDTELNEKLIRRLKREKIESVTIYTPLRPIKLSEVEERFTQFKDNEVMMQLMRGYIAFLEKRGLLVRD